MTQCDRILMHLQEHGSITSQEAMERYGIFRLASRVNDLRNRGYRIQTDTTEGRNRYGEEIHYATYRLKEPEEEYRC